MLHQFFGLKDTDTPDEITSNRDPMRKDINIMDSPRKHRFFRQSSIQNKSFRSKNQKSLKNFSTDFQVMYKIVFDHPQFNFVSVETRTSMVLTASSGVVESHHFLKEKNETLVILSQVEAYLVPTDIDIHIGIQWLDHHGKIPTTDDAAEPHARKSLQSLFRVNNGNVPQASNNLSLSDPEVLKSKKTLLEDCESALLKKVLSDCTVKLRYVSFEKVDIQSDKSKRPRRSFVQSNELNMDFNRAQECSSNTNVDFVHVEIPELLVTLDSPSFFALSRVIRSVLIVPAPTVKQEEIKKDANLLDVELVNIYLKSILFSSIYIYICLSL